MVSFERNNHCQQISLKQFNEIKPLIAYLDEELVQVSVAKMRQVKILLDIAVRRVHPIEIKRRLVDLEEYRLVLLKVFRPRFLYYGGFYEKPRKQDGKEEKSEKEDDEKTNEF